MTRYYFHIREKLAFIPDDDGMELRDFDAAHAEARATAADLIAADRLSGRHPQDCVIEITDRNGVLLEVLPTHCILH